MFKVNIIGIFVIKFIIKRWKWSVAWILKMYWKCPVGATKPNQLKYRCITSYFSTEKGISYSAHGNIKSHPRRPTLDKKWYGSVFCLLLLCFFLRKVWCKYDPVSNYQDKLVLRSRWVSALITTQTGWPQVGQQLT